jgi:hypothetical protein
MGRPIDIKSFKKANRTTYNRIYAEGYQDAYRQLKANGQIQLYCIESQPNCTAAESDSRCTELPGESKRLCG